MPLKNWSVVAGSNTSAAPNGAPEGMTIASVNDTMRQIMADVRTLAAPSTIAAAATTDIGSKDETFLTLTGVAVTITALGTVSAGIYKAIIYNAAHTLTHNATSLILLGGANRTVAAGNVSLMLSEGSGNWRELFYERGDGAVSGSGSLLTSLNAAWPIGSVYIAVVSTNPNTLLGFGTWAAFGAGRVLVGFDATQTEFDVVEETGGAKTHTLATSEIPAHSHSLSIAEGGNLFGNGVTTSLGTGSGTGGLVTASIANAGGGGAHNNLQPYIVCYFWKRTA